MIGSSLSAQNMNKCIIYGTGLMTESLVQHIKDKPEKIISVRGPETRRVLLQHGISCPEHYGDTALLLPLFYSPRPPVKKYISIIPHLETLPEFNPVVDELIKERKCNMINVTKYDKWTDIIDMIAVSSFVLSESLHGLITAETYNIPCLWVEFKNHRNKKFNFTDEGKFKFIDFYESIGKYNMESIKLYEGYNFDDLMTHIDKWKPGNICYEKQLEYSPFEIKPEFKSQIAELLSTHKQCYNQ